MEEALVLVSLYSTNQSFGQLNVNHPVEADDSLLRRFLGLSTTRSPPTPSSRRPATISRDLFFVKLSYQLPTQMRLLQILPGFPVAEPPAPSNPKLGRVRCHGRLRET